MKKGSGLFVIFLLSVLSGCVAPVPEPLTPTAPGRTIEPEKGPALKQGEKIRVLVLNGQTEIDIKGLKSRFKVRYVGSGRAEVNGEAMRLPVRFSSRRGSLHVNERPFRGTVDVFEGEEGMFVVNELLLESYLAGLINNEISSKWPEESVKAQAVIARTYALFQKERRKDEIFHLTSSVMDQVYTGSIAEDPAALGAVRETEGEVLYFNNSLALTVYHSNAGGESEASVNVWAKDYPYLRALKSPYDSSAPNFTWDLVLMSRTLEGLLDKAGYGVFEPVWILPVERSTSGRIKSLVIKDKNGRSLVLTGEELRKVVGYGTLKSTLFEVDKTGDVFVFKGRGSGHGVGLSQWGAKGMAEEGYSYREILEYFYPGTSLVKVY